MNTKYIHAVNKLFPLQLRAQCVGTRRVLSHLVIGSGIQHRFVNGPTLFLSYFNDLYDFGQSDVPLFADGIRMVTVRSNDHYYTL